MRGESLRMALHAPSQEEILDQTERVWQNTDKQNFLYSIMGHQMCLES